MLYSLTAAAADDGVRMAAALCFCERKMTVLFVSLEDGRLYRLRLLRSLQCLLVLLLLSGCGGSTSDQRGTRVGGVGLVHLDGAPLPAGRIVMISDQGNGQVKASALIEDGVFQFCEDSGPLAGSVRVEIHPVRLELEEFEARRGEDPSASVEWKAVRIPPQYNVMSTLTADVSTVDGIVPINFELVSQPKPLRKM